METHYLDIFEQYLHLIYIFSQICFCYKYEVYSILSVLCTSSKMQFFFGNKIYLQSLYTSGLVVLYNKNNFTCEFFHSNCLENYHFLLITYFLLSKFIVLYNLLKIRNYIYSFLQLLKVRDQPLTTQISFQFISQKKR